MSEEHVGCDRQLFCTHNGTAPRWREAEKLIQESAQSTTKLNGSERKSRACTESDDSRQDDMFREVAGRA